MIAPLTLAQMVAASRLEATRAAIVATLRTYLQGVTVIEHPGKLDISDVVAKAVIAAPGVAVGWTRVRGDRAVDGAYATPVEWAAYIVTEDRGDVATGRRMERDSVAHGIGSFILRILNDPEIPLWGLDLVTPPAAEPAPELKPIFTAKSFEAGTAYYAVTWMQGLADEGESYFAGATPSIDAAAGAADWPQVDDGSEAIPEAIRALLAEEEE